MIPIRSKRIYSIQSALKCARRELKLYIFTEVYDVTLVVKTLRSTNPWMNVLKWSKLQRISPAQGVGSNGHCVVSLSMSIGTKRTSNEQIIWIRCVNKERHAEYAGGDGGGWVFGEDWNWEPLGISFFKIYFLCFYLHFVFNLNYISNLCSVCFQCSMLTASQ